MSKKLSCQALGKGFQPCKKEQWNTSPADFKPCDQKIHDVFNY